MKKKIEKKKNKIKKNEKKKEISVKVLLRWGGASP